jgi:hypothetical protein
MAQIQSQYTSTPGQASSSGQSQPMKFQNCLLVTRHELLRMQQEDLATVCININKIDTLPNNIDELKKLTTQYDCIVGVIPLPFQVQLLQLHKSVLLFYMESLGTTNSRQEAEELLKKSKLEGVILPPAKNGEPYRVSAYKGLIRVKNIVVEDEWVVQH